MTARTIPNSPPDSVVLIIKQRYDMLSDNVWYKDVSHQAEIQFVLIPILYSGAYSQRRWRGFNPTNKQTNKPLGKTTLYLQNSRSVCVK